MTKISIVIPVYNREGFLKDTLDSVLNQTSENWECIIVDDGSTDSSQSIAQDYVKKDNRFSFYQRDDNRKKGANACRNIGIEHAQGDYVLFLDSDDILAPNCIEQRLEMANQFPDKKLHVFGMGSLEGNQLVNKTWSKPISDFDQILKEFVLLRVPWSMPCGLWDKEVLFDIGKFDEELPRFQDPEIHLRMLMKHGDKVNYQYRDDTIDVYYRINHKNTYNQEMYQKLVDSFMIYSKKILVNNLKLDWVKLSLKRYFIRFITYPQVSTEIKTDALNRYMSHLETLNVFSAIQIKKLKQSIPFLMSVSNIPYSNKAMLLYMYSSDLLNQLKTKYETKN